MVATGTLYVRILNCQTITTNIADTEPLVRRIYTCYSLSSKCPKRLVCLMLVVLFGEAVDPFGGGALLVEIDH